MDNEYNNPFTQEYLELNKGEIEIKNKIKESFQFDNQYKKYGIINKDWYIEYKDYLNNFLDYNNKKKIKIIHYLKLIIYFQKLRKKIIAI